MGAAAGGKEGKVESEPPRPRDGPEQDKNLNRLTRTARAGDGCDSSCTCNARHIFVSVKYVFVSVKLVYVYVKLLKI
jgi:hypothetical protein